MDIKTIIKALRCSGGTEHECDHSCPYFYTETDEDIDKFCREHNAKRENFPDDFWDGCDYERAALDAADALERLTDGKC